MSRGGFGRGRGRGGGPGASGPINGLAFQELGQMDKTPSKNYPDMTSMPKMEKPDEKELRYAELQLFYLSEQKNSPYWPRLEEKKEADLARFTDRYRPETKDVPSLKSVNMQKDVFPKGLWNSFMEGETRREEIKAKKREKKAKINWEGLDLEEKAGGDGEEAENGSSEPEDLGDYEDEEDDDYAENYFDNGEDDDLGDDGGGDEAAYD
ncbi:hypothetical protein IE53DRAFT_316128 [Violaceomyces palustris]|uniref:Uncharacterized protein n=1 Tax=Violaceomyces palustris TaxID=1673888 RepID=A0ACD0NWS9_9BASI|nr:hypothetical protein IE53DRAFT_316128 [Violaceomyces palustris]